LAPNIVFLTIRWGFMRWLIAFFLLWFAFGSPKNDIANTLWPDREAPWETVDAFYYPDKNDLSKALKNIGLQNIQSCRTWVRAKAEHEGDLALQRGDYECGLGKPYSYENISVYRASVR